MPPVKLNPSALAAQQTWDAMPLWQKALVGYGAGASNVLRKDIVHPSLMLGEKLHLAKRGAAERYARATESMNAPFESLQGAAPKTLSAVGEASTLLPAAMLTDGAVDAALPEAAGGGMLGALRRMAPMSAGGAALGGLEPDNRGPSAVYGALVPPAARLGGRIAAGAGFPLLRALHQTGHMSPGAAYNMLLGLPAMMHSLREAIPKTLERPYEIAMDTLKKRTVSRPPKAILRRTLFEQGGAEAPNDNSGT